MDERFPELTEVGRYIDAPAILHGETVVLGERGHPSFERLSARLAARPGNCPLATFVAFDVLKASLVERPWSERRRALTELQLDGMRAAATWCATTARQCSPRPALWESKV